jgi:hypothetical protein
MIFTDGPSDRPRKGRRIQDGPDRLAKLRAYWNAKTTRYRRRDKAGLKVISLEADPSDIRDFCVEAGVAVPDLDPKTLGKSLMVLLDHWREGRVTVVRAE